MPEVGEKIEAFGQSVEVTEVDPPKTLAWNWGDENYSFELRPDGDGTILVFTHVFEDRSLGAQHGSGWEIHFDRLDTHLAGGSLSPEDAHDPERMLEIHDAYAERFDLDPTPGRRMIARVSPPPATLDDDGPTLRFERRLGHPVERVWRAITDGDERLKWWPQYGPFVPSHTDEPNLLIAPWGDDGELRFELSDDGEDGTLLVFTHRFVGRETAARNAAGWESTFVRLSALLEGEPIDEDASMETWPHKHEIYAKRFGVDPELGREALRYLQSRKQ